MSSADKSMEKINYIKLLVFLTVFIIVALILILFFILPSVKEYRSARANFERANVYKIRAENILKERNEELKKLKVENRKIFDSFEHDFSKREFISFANKFFSKVKLQKVKESDYKKEFVEYELNVTSSLRTPVNFYRFLEGLNNYTNIIQADFPIELKSDGKSINSSFKIKVYKEKSEK